MIHTSRLLNVVARRLLAAVAVLVLLAGCGGGSSAPSSAGNGLTASTLTVTPSPTPRIARVAVIAPINAGLTAFGRGILNSVRLAVDQANASGALPGFLLVVDPHDDASTPSVGAAAAQIVAADPTVIGVIGTYNSGVAAQVAPILQRASIVEISPANTDPTLTLGANPQIPVRPFNNYFRMVVPDSIQGPALATYAFTQLGVRRVAVVTESKSVSKGLADDFSRAFTALGGSIVTTEVVPAGTTDYSAILARVATNNFQLLFYGGEYSSGITVRKQARAAGITVPMMGGDGLKDDAYIAGAGAAAEGDYASTVGAPPDQLPGGKSFLAAYQAAGFTDPPSDYGPYAFDATNTLIAAARAALQGKTIDTSSRSAIIASVQATASSGVTGPIGFDAFGDTRNKILTVYQVKNGRWVPLQTLSE